MLKSFRDSYCVWGSRVCKQARCIISGLADLFWDRLFVFKEATATELLSPPAELLAWDLTQESRCSSFPSNPSVCISVDRFVENPEKSLLYDANLATARNLSLLNRASFLKNADAMHPNRWTDYFVLWETTEFLRLVVGRDRKSLCEETPTADTDSWRYRISLTQRQRGALHLLFITLWQTFWLLQWPTEEKTFPSYLLHFPFLQFSMPRGRAFLQKTPIQGILWRSSLISRQSRRISRDEQALN